MEEIPHSRLFRFGIFEADRHTGELRKQGRRLSLQGQPFDVLVMLLERPGELVSRAQLRERLWPDGTFVDFDHSLNTAINKIRDALGDSASSPRFIETLARRGYRFIAPVQIDGNSGEGALNLSAEPSPPASPAVEPELAERQLAEPQTATIASGDARETLLTGSHEVPQASRALVRTLFLLLQVMYFCFYLVALARLYIVEEIAATTFSHPHWAVGLLVVTAIVGIPVRLYLISAAAFKAPGLREKFLRLFVVILLLDELWALAPFLLLPWIGYGLVLASTAILLYVPFAERSLILMGAGESEPGK